MGGEEKIPKNLYIYALGCKYFTVLNFFFFSILRMNFGFVSRIPKTTLSLDDLLERSPDSENKLTLMVHYSKKMSTDISKGNRVMCKLQEKPETSIQVSSLSGITWIHSILPASVWKCVPNTVNRGSSPEP